MKIGVYAICKNETGEIADWFKSCEDADEIVVIDTGSTDGSWGHLRARHKIDSRSAAVMPWRFDDAFNMAMNALSPFVDVAIRLDLDERLSGNWRAAVEKAWTPTTTRLRYPYVWNWLAPGKPDRRWWGDRIHARAGYRWSGVTHEGLMCRGAQVETYTEDMHIHHFMKGDKARPNDLPMLEEATRETPNDVRLWAYLCREYMWRGRNIDAIHAGKHFLTLKGDRQETLMVLQSLAKADPGTSIGWLHRATRLCPEFREPWVELAMLYYLAKNWAACLDAAWTALKIKQRPVSYMCVAEAWGARPHDLAAIALWNLGRKAEAIVQATLALELEPGDLRLQANLASMTADTTG